MEESNGFGYFVLGLGLGVAAGVLLAPKAGAETRDLLAAKAGEGTDYLRARANESTDYLRARAEDGKEYLKQRGSDIAGTASDIVEKGKTAVHRRKDTLNAAVEAGKQAYREAVSSFEANTGGGGV